MLLKINLLPEGARRTGASGVEQLHRTPLAWVVAGGMVALPLLLCVPLLGRQHRLRVVSAKVELLKPRKAEIDQLQQVLQRLRVQETAFRGLEHGQDLWSQRLNALSNLTPDGVWFTELALDEAKGLVIQGAAIGQIGEISVTRFAQELKGNRGLGSAVKDVQIESIKHVQDGELDIVQFTLTCPLAGSAG